MLRLGEIVIVIGFLHGEGEFPFKQRQHGDDVGLLDDFRRGGGAVFPSPILLGVLKAASDFVYGRIFFLEVAFELLNHPIFVLLREIESL